MTTAPQTTQNVLTPEMIATLVGELLEEERRYYGQGIDTEKLELIEELKGQDFAAGIVARDGVRNGSEPFPVVYFLGDAVSAMAKRWTRPHRAADSAEVQRNSRDSISDDLRAYYTRCAIGNERYRALTLVNNALMIASPTFEFDRGLDTAAREELNDADVAPVIEAAIHVLALALILSEPDMRHDESERPRDRRTRREQVADACDAHTRQVFRALHRAGEVSDQRFDGEGFISLLRNCVTV